MFSLNTVLICSAINHLFIKVCNTLVFTQEINFIYYETIRYIVFIYSTGSRDHVHKC